jgi:hypothetical protein
MMEDDLQVLMEEINNKRNDNWWLKLCFLITTNTTMM